MSHFKGIQYNIQLFEYDKGERWQIREQFGNIETKVSPRIRGSLVQLTLLSSSMVF